MSNQIVKPLEWVEHGDNGYEWHRATPPIGERYNIEDDGFSAKKLTVTVGQLVLGNFDSLDEGKAAAQADYEQRILAALSVDLPSLQEDDDAKTDTLEAGIDMATTQLCKVLNVDPSAVTWDTATETLEGDVQAQIFNIFRARYGENWSPSLDLQEIAEKDARIERLEAALEAILCMHDGNPPLPLADLPEIDYARRTISNIHREARAALRGQEPYNA